MGGEEWRNTRIGGRGVVEPEGGALVEGESSRDMERCRVHGGKGILLFTKGKHILRGMCIFEGDG